MLAMEVGSVLVKLAQGGEVALTEGEHLALEALEREGLVERAPDTSEAEAQLALRRAELSALATPAARAAHEARLRTEILALSEAVVRGRGAACVMVQRGAAYRGASAPQGFVVTFAGRALLSDLAPRLARVGAMEVQRFRAHMDALRVTFARRAQRAAEVFAALRPANTVVSESALRSVALGLSARGGKPAELAVAWRSRFEALRTSEGRKSGTPRWTANQEAAAAEALLLLATSSAQESSVERLEMLRGQAYLNYCEQNGEDALDAALHLMTLADTRRAIEEAAAFATEMKQLSTPMTLSVALALRAANQLKHGAIFTHFYYELARANEGTDDRERHAAALALTLAPAAPSTTLARARELRGYLTRFAATGMLVPACLLATLPVEPSEALDLLRLASSELQKARFEGGGAESLTLAVKFLLQTVILAAGSEGDAEEELDLLRFDGLALEALGHAGLVSHIPLSLTALTAFHRPALDATVVYQELFQPMHSSSVFSGGHRSGGWG